MKDKTWRKPWNSCPSGRKIGSLYLGLLLLVIPGCSKDKSNRQDQNQQPSAEEEYLETLPSTQLLITFSVINDLGITYPHLRLGLYDIIAHIRVDGLIQFVSLEGKEPAADVDFNEASPLELTLINENTHLFHGFFNVPAGKLEGLSVQFSGGASSIVMDEGQLHLFDAFGHSYQGDITQNLRHYPAEVFADQALSLTEGTLHALDIGIDINLTATKVPGADEDTPESRGVFTPAIRLSTLPDSFMMVIDKVYNTQIENGTLSLTEGSGTTGGFEEPKWIIPFTEDSSATVYINNGHKDQLSSFSGYAHVFLRGLMNIREPGVTFDVTSARLANIAETGNTSFITGVITVDGETPAVEGFEQPLDSKRARLGSRFLSEAKPLNGATPGTLPQGRITLHTEGERILSVVESRVASETTTQTSEPPTPPDDPEQRFMIKADLRHTPPDLLSISEATFDESGMTLDLKEKLPCAHFLVNSDEKENSPPSCGIMTLVFPLSQTGEFTLLKTREAEESEENGEIRYELEDDLTEHFTLMEDFTRNLYTLVTENHYRLVTLAGTGTLTNSTFVLNHKVKATLLAPQPALDTAADDNIRNATREDSGALTHKEITALAIGVTGAVGIGSLAIALGKKFIPPLLVKKLKRQVIVDYRPFIDRFQFAVRDANDELRQFELSGFGDGVNLADVRIESDGSILVTLDENPTDAEVQDPSKIRTVEVVNNLGEIQGGVTLRALSPDPVPALFAKDTGQAVTDHRLFLSPAGDGSDAIEFIPAKAVVKDLPGTGTSYSYNGQTLVLTHEGQLRSSGSARIALAPKDTLPQGTPELFQSTLNGFELKAVFQAEENAKVNTLSGLYQAYKARTPQIPAYLPPVKGNANGVFKFNDGIRDRFISNIDLETLSGEMQRIYITSTPSREPGDFSLTTNAYAWRDNGDGLTLAALAKDFNILSTVTTTDKDGRRKTDIVLGEGYKSITVYSSLRPGGLANIEGNEVVTEAFIRAHQKSQDDLTEKRVQYLQALDELKTTPLSVLQTDIQGRYKQFRPVTRHTSRPVDAGSDFRPSGTSRKPRTTGKRY